MTNQDKKKIYEEATQKLLAQLNTMGLSPKKKKTAIYFTKLFREAFKYNEIKEYVFTGPKDVFVDLGYDSAGFCYASSVVFSIMNGFPDWQLMYIDEYKWPGQLPHYYLKHVQSGKFFDITFDQFSIDGFTVPYELGETAPFAMTPGDVPFKFADALGLNLIETLKNTRK